MKTTLFAALLLAAAGTAQTYTLTSFGTQCGGDLQAQLVTAPAGVGVHLGITGAAPHAFALLVLGHPQPAPVPLPGSQCLLLVDPRLTLRDMTSAAGSVRFGFRVPPVLPITIDFQALIIDFAPSGLVVTSTDGVRLIGV